MMDKIVGSFLFPPGYDGESEYKRIRLFLGFAIGWSFQFLFRYYDAYKDLFYDAYHMSYTRYGSMGLKDGDLLPGVKIEPFGEILGNSMLFFAPLLLSIVVAGVVHYLYYSQGSRAIFLVRRLPDRHYVWKTCVLGPVIGLLISLAAMGLLLGVYYWIYMTVTPVVCLPS